MAQDSATLSPVIQQMLQAAVYDNEARVTTNTKPKVNLVYVEGRRGNKLFVGRKLRDVAVPCYVNLSEATGLSICECPARIPHPDKPGEQIEVTLTMGRIAAQLLMRYISRRSLKPVDGWTDVGNLRSAGLQEMLPIHRE